MMINNAYVMDLKEEEESEWAASRVSLNMFSPFIFHKETALND